LKPLGVSYYWRNDVWIVKYISYMYILYVFLRGHKRKMAPRRTLKRNGVIAITLDILCIINHIDLYWFSGSSSSVSRPKNLYYYILKSHTLHSSYIKERTRLYLVFYLDGAGENFWRRIKENINTKNINTGTNWCFKLFLSCAHFLIRRSSGSEQMDW